MRVTIDLDKLLEEGKINQAEYDKLYAEYVTLHDYFGRGANDVMKRLKALKAEAKTGA